MKIVILNHYIGPKRYCPPYRTNILADEWVKNGHKVVIICASYSHLFFELPKFKGLVSTEECEGVEYEIIKTPAFQGNSILRVMNILTFVLLTTFMSRRISKKYYPDIVIASSVYPLDIIPSILISLFAKAKLLREVRDLWPLTLLELGKSSVWNPFILLLKYSQWLSFKKAKIVITTLLNSLPYMEAHGLDKNKWKYVPQGITLCNKNLTNTKLSPEIVRTLVKYKNEGKFILGYAGGHGNANALKYLIDAANILRNENIVFVLVGQGPEKDKLIEYTQKSGILNVCYFSPIPKNAIPAFLSYIDSAYIGWKKSSLYKYGISPNKLMDYMICGKPVLHSTDTVDDLVATSMCGYVVPAEDAIRIAEAIMRLMGISKEERESMGKRGKEFVEKHRNHSILAAQYLQVINESI